MRRCRETPGLVDPGPIYDVTDLHLAVPQDLDDEAGAGAGHAGAGHKVQVRPRPRRPGAQIGTEAFAPRPPIGAKAAFRLLERVHFARRTLADFP